MAILISDMYLTIIECLVLICDFHREQAWGRWLSRKTNGMAHLKEKALAAMRKIARARTETEFLKEVESLKQDEDLWSNSMYKKYMENTWLKEHKVGFAKKLQQMILINNIRLGTWQFGV